MAVTATPVLPQTPNVGALNCILSTAMTNTKAFDGTETAGTALALAYTAGANGSRVDFAKVKLASTNGATASGTSSATVVRFWLNNGSANTTAGNNIFLDEIAIPATAVTSLASSVTTTYYLPINFAIPGGYRIYAGATVAVGGTNIGLAVNIVGADL